MALYLELKRKIDSDGGPLEKRIHLAHDIFISRRLQIERKEEVALECLCKFLSKSSSIDAWNALLSCIDSQKMKQMHSLDIQPAIKDLLIDTLKHFLSSASSSEIKKIAATCSMHLLQESSMEHYFNHKHMKFIELCVVLFSYFSTCPLKEDVLSSARQLIVLILAYHKRLPEDLDFRDKFLNDILVPLIKVQSAWRESSVEIEQFRKDVIKCLQVLVMGREHQKNYDSIINFAFKIESDSEFTNDALLIQINLHGAHFSTVEMQDFFSLILQALISSYKKSRNLIVGMFFVFNHIIGIRPTTDPYIQTKNVEKLLNSSVLPQAVIKKSELIALRVMLEVLGKEDINFDECLIGDKSGSAMLARLMTHVLASFSTHHISSLLHVLSALTAVDLMLLESLLKDIITWVLSVPMNQVLKNSFSAFMVEALKVSEKEHRDHKIICYFLEGVKVGLDKNNQNITALVSQDFLKQLENCCTKMHSKNYYTVVSALLFSLEHNCIEFFEDKTNTASDRLPLLEILVKLLRSALFASRAAHHTTPGPVLTKFCNLMNSMAQLLARLSHTGRKNSEILEQFFSLCWVWGEVRLLLVHYADHASCPSLTVPALTQDQEVYHLQMLHSYITDSEWSKLCNKASDNKACTTHMMSLLDQKLRCFILFEIGTEEQKCDLAEEIATQYCCHGPLQSNLPVLLPLLKAKTKTKLAGVIANDLLQSGPWSEALKLQCSLGDGKFVARVILALLHSIKEDRFGSSHDLLEHLDKKKFTADCLPLMMSSFKLDVNHKEKMNPKLESFLSSMSLLPLEEMQKYARVACALVVITACCGIQQNWDIPAKLIIRLLGTRGKSAPLPKTFNYGLILTWILSSKALKSLPVSLQDCLVSSLLGGTTVSTDSLSSGIEELKILLKQDNLSNTTTSVVNFILPHFYDHLSKQHNKKQVELQSYTKELSKCVIKHNNILILPALCSALLFLENSKPKLVKEFVSALPSLVQTADVKVLDLVLPCVTKLNVENSRAVMNELWPYLCSLGHVSQISQQAMQKLIINATTEQIDKVVNVLVNQQMASGFTVWQCLINSTSPQRYLRKLQNSIRSNLPTWDLSETCLNMKVLPTLALLNTIAKSKVDLEYMLVDICFDSILYLQLESRPSGEELINCIRAAAILLNTLSTSRAVLILERIPVLQQRLNYVMTSLVKAAQRTVSTDMANQLASSAHILEGIAVGMYVYKKDFARAAPHLLADVLNLFENYIHQTVKLPLEQYVEALVRLCDEYSEHFLLRTLSPASQQLLRVQLDLMKRDRHLRA